MKQNQHQNFQYNKGKKRHPLVDFFKLCPRVLENSKRKTNGNKGDQDRERERRAGKQGGAHTFQKNDIMKPSRAVPDPSSRGPGSPALSSHLSATESPLKASCDGQKSMPACATPPFLAPLSDRGYPSPYMSFFSHWVFLFFPNVTTFPFFDILQELLFISAPHPTPFSPTSCHQLVRIFFLVFRFLLK